MAVAVLHQRQPVLVPLDLQRWRAVNQHLQVDGVPDLQVLVEQTLREARILDVIAPAIVDEPDALDGVRVLAALDQDGQLVVGPAILQFAAPANGRTACDCGDVGAMVLMEVLLDPPVDVADQRRVGQRAVDIATCQTVLEARIQHVHEARHGAGAAIDGIFKTNQLRCCGSYMLFS